MNEECRISRIERRLQQVCDILEKFGCPEGYSKCLFEDRIYEEELCHECGTSINDCLCDKEDEDNIFHPNDNE